MLSVENLTMSFPGTLALDAVDLDVGRGEVHALVGQNGSGKSTAIKILSGYYVPTGESRVHVNGTPLKFGSPQHSRRCGLRFVHQDLGLIPGLSAIENMAMSNGYTGSAGRPIRWARERRRVEDVVFGLGYDFDVTAPVSTLTPAQRTGVALGRALDGCETEAHVLVLDEPTAALPKPEVDSLFDVLDRIRRSGVAVLYVSHHLEEILLISDRVTALRGGRRVATVDRSELDHGRLVELIVGSKVDGAVPDAHTRATSKVALRARGLAGTRLRAMDLDVRSGEIIGIAGLDGSGREEFASLVFGASPRTGDIDVDGKALRAGHPAASVAAGVALLPADRQAQGIFPAMAVRQNLMVSSLRRGRRRIRTAAERHDALQWLDRLSVSPRQTEIPISALSGGNQQKVLIAKWLRISPKVMLLDDPTQGVDVGSRAQIYGHLRAAAAAGCAIVVSSSDSAELAQLCHRVLVVGRGRVTAELEGAGMTAEAIDTCCLRIDVAVEQVPA